MQKKKARKGFLFLRRESVLPPCRAGPVCPAGTNAVFCGGTHGLRPTRCGGHTGRTESSAPTHLVIASQSALRSKCPWGTDWRGNPFPARQGRADGASYPKGICSAALHCRTPSPTKSQGVRCKKADRCPPFTFLLYMIALSATMRCKNTAPACPAPHGHR